MSSKYKLRGKKVQTDELSAGSNPQYTQTLEGYVRITQWLTLSMLA